MRFLTPLFVFACSSAPALPLSQAGAPGAAGMTLSGPTFVVPGLTYTWEVRADDLRVGDEVDLGWGEVQSTGLCPYRRRVGGWLCLDIDRSANRALHIMGTTAIDDPTAPGTAVARFELSVPGTTFDHVWLQALRIDGLNSATSNPLQVEFPGGPCPDRDAVIDTQADVDAYAGCRVLDSLRAVGVDPSLTTLSLPALRWVNGDVTLTSSRLELIDLPALEGVGGNIDARNNDIVDVQAPQLRRVSGNIDFEGTDGLASFEMPNLEQVGGQLKLQNIGTAPAVLSFPSLHTLSANGGIDVESVGDLTAVELPALLSGSLEFRFNDDLISVTAPNLSQGGWVAIAMNQLQTVLDLSSLQHTSSFFSITHMAAMETLQLGQLQTVGSSFQLYVVRQLQTADLTTLTSIDGNVDFFANDAYCVDPSVDFNALSSGNVNFTGTYCAP